MANKQNPFAALGLTHELVSSRTPAHVRELVERVGRVMLTVTHPDFPGGSTSQFIVIQNALNELNDPEKFDHYLRLYTRPSSTKLAETSEKLAACEDRNQRAKRQFRSYLGALSVQSWLGGASTEGLEIRLHDTVIHDRQGYPLGEPHCVTIMLSREGMVEARNGAQKQVTRTPIGCIPKCSLGPGGIRPLMLRCQGRQETAPVTRWQLNPHKVRGKEKNTDTHQSPWELADPVLERLTPHLAVDSFLYSRGMFAQEPCLYLEGLIIAITAVEP